MALRPTPVFGSSASLAAPTGGWNARDALADMNPLDAVSMSNFIPNTTSVDLRSGYTRYSTGYPSQVETVMAYAGGTSNQLFGVSNGSIYDATSGGAVGAAVMTGLSNSRFQYINFATTAGNYIRTVNAADKSRVYDGTTWHTDGDGAPYDITGADSATFNNINQFKSRMWFTQSGTLNAYYLPTSNLGGAVTAFPLQAVAKMGGYLVGMANLTIDAGQGIDDYAVFFTSKGEVIVYQGTDPASVTTFALRGVWTLGAPVGVRSFCKYAGDLLLTCQDGLIPLSGALQSSRVNPKVALTDKIQLAVNNAVTTYGGNFGWQPIYLPKVNLVLLNIPINVGLQQQFLMNTLTRSWCNFTGWAANCWELFDDDAYFGGTNYIGKAFDSLSDDGAQISGDVKQAFNYFKMPGLQKRWTMMRPVLLSNGQPSYLAGINVDFDDSPLSALPNFSPVSYGTWDNALWDVAVWGGDLSVIKNWQGITGIGYCAAPRLTVSCMGIRLNWAATDIVMERGAIL